MDKTFGECMSAEAERVWRNKFVGPGDANAPSYLIKAPVPFHHFHTAFFEGVSWMQTVVSKSKNGYPIDMETSAQLVYASYLPDGP
jgi:hypothetical protein